MRSQNEFSWRNARMQHTNWTVFNEHWALNIEQYTQNKQVQKVFFFPFYEVNEHSVTEEHFQVELWLKFIIQTIYFNACGGLMMQSFLVLVFFCPFFIYFKKQKTKKTEEKEKDKKSKPFGVRALSIINSSDNTKQLAMAEKRSLLSCRYHPLMSAMNVEISMETMFNVQVCCWPADSSC